MVCPISGCIINKTAIIEVIKNEIIYLKWTFEYFWLLNIKLMKMIKNGFTNSTGWNLGNKYKSIHLFEPFTSIPNTGTKNKINNEKRKITSDRLKRLSLLIEENIKITKIPKRIKIKCLKKNE